ncbi:hypothetical protein [Hymenobacter metallilatus]|uniref:Uncharacterized protein n=1 Tax=Hymenobacter metallilatus TaxID=2493666 RepID=A0A3R9MN63_9BACT|nr:hypothetical protein [Hymenobacter metallilatus]RSK36146.1 hypothetical protein EI290_04480 [Hymenobacter metallilatus]
MRYLLAGCGLVLWLSSAALAQTVEISLAGQTLAPVTAPFHVERLVDARPDRTRLGKVYRGLDNRPVSANFSHSLTDELMPLLRQALPAGPGTRPLLVRIHTLSIGETIRPTSETAEAELVLDFLEPVGSDGYRVLLSTGDMLENKGVDVTRRHAANIQTLLEQSIRQLSTLPPAPVPDTPVLTWDQVQAGQDGAPTVRYAVQTGPLQKGVYHTFEEFRNNTPSQDDGPFEIEKTPRRKKEWAGTFDIQPYYLYLDAQHPRRPVAKAWGISDGQTMYIRYRNHYFPLEAAGPDYSFTGFRNPEPDEMMTRAAMGAAFGLAGAALAAATLPDGSLPQRYELHLTTGRVVAHSLPTVGADGFVREDTAAVYLYRRPDSQPTQAVTVQVDGRQVGELLPGSYLALSWRDRRREMNLCVRGQAETCKVFVPDFAAATYLECGFGSSTEAAPTLKAVPPKEGVFYLKKFRSRQRPQ